MPLSSFFELTVGVQMIRMRISGQFHHEIVTKGSQYEISIATSEFLSTLNE
jgi:hypothetical protein